MGIQEPNARRIRVKTYIFKVALQQEKDGRWSIWVPALPGCTAWGHTKEEALKAIQDAAEAYLEDMIEVGEPVPGLPDVEIIEAPAVAVTV